MKIILMRDINNHSYVQKKGATIFNFSAERSVDKMLEKSGMKTSKKSAVNKDVIFIEEQCQ